MSISFVLRGDDTMAVLVEEANVSSGSMTGQVGTACALGCGGRRTKGDQQGEHGHDSRWRKA